MTTLKKKPPRRPPSAPAVEVSRLLVLMDHSLDFIELLGRKGIIEGASSAITSLAGYDPAELVGQHYRNLIHPQDRKQAAIAFAKVLSRGRAGPIKLRYRSKDGRWRTVFASARNYLSDGSTRAIVVLTRDVTEQLLAERRLHTANEELRRLTRELMDTQESERAHLARELHDDIAQALAGLSLAMSATSKFPAAAISAELVSTWQDHVQEVLEHLRALTESLHPLALQQLGLASAIQALVTRLELVSGIEIQLDVKSEIGKLAPGVELTCFRIVQEALNNALKHSGAHAVQVSLSRVANDIHVAIHDDGNGFDVPAARERAIGAGRVGLLSMRERASLTGGHFTITSEAGKGTDITADVPC